MNLDDKHMTIIAMIRQSELCPSYQEIGDAVGLGFSATKARIWKLVKAGYLEKQHGTKRAIRVTEKGHALFPELVVVKQRDGVFTPYQSS